MSDPREYNYISANNGLQVSIGSYWASAERAPFVPRTTDHLATGLAN